MDREAGIKKLAELMDGVHICTMTTTDQDGQLISRPMGLQNKDFNGELWFFTTDTSAKVQQIAAKPEVNISFEKSNSYVSISGEATMVDDRAKTEELWNPIMKAWFPDGLETPDLQLMKVTTTSAQFWDTSNSKIVSLYAYAKAVVTGDRPNSGELGEVKTVDLED